MSVGGEDGEAVGAVGLPVGLLEARSITVGNKLSVLFLSNKESSSESCACTSRLTPITRRQRNKDCNSRLMSEAFSINRLLTVCIL